MAVFDKNKCTGCGSCVKDCVFGAIKLNEGKAEKEGQCILCGHCVAVCHKEAVSIPEYDMSDVEPFNKELYSFDIDNLLHTIKFRRSIRHFTEQPVERIKLENIVQAGRYTATGVNRQSCRFIVVQDKLKELKAAIWNGIDDILKNPDSVDEDAMKSVQHLDNMRAGGIDFLFRNAPATIYIAAESTVDASLAAQNMELAAISQGLGVLYNGYLVRMSSLIPEASSMLDLQGKQIIINMLLGYPQLTYRRTAPRKKADVVWR